MAILRHDTVMRNADGQTMSTMVTTANIGTYGVAANSTYYIGTTQNVFNRASGAQTLTGVSIDGNAANITAYTINQNLGTANAPSFAGATLSSTLAINGGDGLRAFRAGAATVTSHIYWANVANTVAYNWQLDENNNAAMWGYTSAWGKLLTATSAGVFTASGDFRAPIFYDSNDTAYYVNPNSSSNLSILRIFSGFDTASSDVYANMRVIRDTAFTDGMYIGYGNAGSGLTRIFGGGATTGELVKHSDHTVESNSFRAPIFYDSNNTAYYLDAANTGTSLLVAGKVGIGTTSPGAPLEVSGASGDGVPTFKITSTSAPSTFNYAGTMFNSSLGASKSYSLMIGKSAASKNSGYIGYNHSGTDGSNTNFLTFGHFQSDYLLNILGNGNVGIGTTNPSWLLTVYAASASQFTLSNATRNFILTNNAGDGLLSFNYASVNRLQFDTTNQWFNTGNVGIGTTSPSASLHIKPTSLGANGFILERYATTAKLIYAYESAADGYLEVRSGADAIVSKISGYASTATYFQSSVGIGTASPSQKLHVVGVGYSDTDFRAPIFYDSNDTTYYIDPANGGFNLRGGTSNRVTFNSGDSGIIITNAEGISSNVRLGCAWGRPGIYNGSSITVGAETQIDFVIGNVLRAYVDSSSNLFGVSSVRAPIFYDSNNTAFYTDPASTSVLNKLTIDGGNYANNYFQSFSDFTSGTLVTTDIPATAAEGESFVMNVIGKSYSSASPFNFSVQGYLYNSTIINYSGIKLDSTGLATIKIFENGGVLCFWWATVSYWNAFEVSVRGYNSARSNYNRVTNITNSTEPVGTKKVAVTLQSFLRADVSATNSVDLRSPIFYDSNNTNYYLDPANSGTSLLVAGKVGLGTTSAISMLDVRGAHASGYGIINVVSTDSALIALDSTGARDHGIRLKYNGVDKWLVGMRDTNESYSFSNSSDTRLVTILQGGNVGIGITSPGYTLTVNGTIAYTPSVGNPVFIGNDATYGTSGTGRYVALGFGGLANSANKIFAHNMGEDGLYICSATSRSIYFRAGGGASDHVIITSGGTFTANVDARAPLFYDSNNTAYYCDPASTSVLAILQATRINFGATGATPYAAAAGEGTGNGITFGGDEAGAGYRIFTSMENWNGSGNYSKLTLNWHTGIKIGAYTNYGGIRFYNNAAGATNPTPSEIFSIGRGDSNVRVENNLIVNGITINQERANNARMYGAGTGAFGLLGLDSAGSFRWQVYGESGNYGFLDSTWGAWDIKKVPNGELDLRVSSANVRVLNAGNYSGYSAFTASLTSTVDARAPIFYDSNNTAYYIDGASGSKLKYLQIDGDWGSSPFGSGHESFTIRSTYASMVQRQTNGGLGYWLHHIASDAAYYLYGGKGATDGSSWDWSYKAYPNQDGSYVEFRTSARAPLFYDSNDTAYYVDPNGTSSLYNLSLVGAKNTYLIINPGNGSEAMVRYIGGSGSGWYVGKRMSSQLVGTADFHFFSEAAGATVGGIDTSGNIFSSGSVRSQIFYDSNNTAYYVDPSSTGYSAYFAGAIQATKIGIEDGGLDCYMEITDANPTVYGVGYGGEFIFYGDKSTPASFLYYGGATVTYTLQANSSLRSPIFYDSNDTGYYCDPASNSVLNGLYVNAYYNLSNDYKDIYVYGDVNTYYVVLIQGEYLYSFGRYSVTRGYNWTGPDTWYIATHKGGLTLDWEWSGDTAWGGNDKAIRIIEFNESYSSTVAGLGYPVNGGVIIWLRGGGVGGAQYRIRTPIGSNATVTVYDGVSATNHSTLTTFTAANSSVFTTRANTDNVSAEILARYPVRSAASLYNDNNLVVDIGSGTQTKSGIFASAASVRAPIFYDTDNTGYYCDPAGSSNFSIVTAADFYTAGWFRNNTNGHGMYNQATGQHFYSDSVNYWNVASSANAQGIRLRTGGYNGTVRGYFYADTNNDVGFLNQDGSWRLRVVGGDYSLADGSSMRAQLFYDSNDTAYYVNPNSTSNLYYITMPHIGNGSANLVVNNGGSENWNAIKINGGNDNNGIGFSNTSHSAFGRNNFSFHTHNLDSIRFHSSGWDTLFEVAGSSGNAWLKGGSFDSSFTRLVNPGGAYYVTGTSTITGAIKIRLPRLNANTMMRMTVKIYQYNTGQCATIECGGYDYSGDGIWRNIFAYQNSDLFATVNVRFGNDGTYDCVWIGETSSTWSYPQVFVTDFQAGYNNYTSDWGTGWNISFVTTFNTVTDTRVAYKTLNAGNYNSYAPTLTGTGASGTWSINVTGNAATVTNGLYTSSTLTAGNLSGTIPSGVLGNSTHYVGTTAIALNRASAGQTLTGISIDGNSGGIYAAGQAFIQTTSAGTSYVQHIQVREAAGGGGLTSEIYAPALGFHWSGVVASNILMESSGRMSIRNNPGTSYENFIANIVYGNSSVQTPILYDSNDTAYYLDPRSTSVLSGLKLNGVDNEAAGTGSDAILWINKPNNNDWGIRVSGNLEYLLKLEGATSHTYNIQGMANGSEFWRCGTDLLYHNSNIRAPIFYDSNNTAYYLDPNSTTSLRTVGSWRSDSSTWDGEFSGKIQYHSNHWYFQSGDLWIFRNSGGTNVATINQSGTISAAFSGSLTGNVTGNVTGTAINIAGNGAGADPYGTIAVTEPANASNYSYYGLTRQANIGAGFGLTGTTGALGFGANAFWFGGATSTAAGVMSSAYIAFNGSSFAAVGTVDATQFRDRDNTAYYIDAASTSNLLGLTVTNTITGNISGTAGSISGFNNPTTAATANTIVYRDSGGDIYGRYLFGSYQNSSDDTSSTGITFIMAKFGDNYHRSASAAKVATFISGQTMNINGSSTSCSGTATTATTANALNTSNSYTIAGLTNNGTATLFPTYGSGYSYFLRMGYDTSGYYDYTIKRDGNTGLLEFNGTQGAPYVGYVFSGGNVGVGTTTPGYKVDVNGSCHATCFPTSSDIRFKKKITPLENSLEKIKKLQGVKYEWNEFVNSVRDGYKLNIPIIGLIAQDVEKVIPEIIDFWKLSDDCQDARSIDYPRLIPFLIEAIKEQQIIIENQNQKIENLMTRMSALEAK